MSWSIAFIGKPDKVVEALEAQSAKFDGQSKVEYDSVLPHLTGIMKENFGTDNAILKVTASGHGYAEKVNDELVQKQRQCVAAVEIFYATLV